MNIIHNFLSEQILQALGWTFIHSLWQGAVIALVLGLILPGLKKRAATFRYTLAVGSLAALVALSVTTFVRCYTNAPAGNPSDVMVAVPGNDDKSASAVELYASTRDVASEDVQETGGFFNAFAGNFTRYFPLVVSLWFLGMMLFLAKMLGGLIYSERIRKTGITPLPDLWSNHLAALKEKMSITRPVKLVESCVAKVPMVIGYIKPVILMPLGVLTGLPRDQVEAIIAHELAHIRRNDFLVNIFQSLFESIFFYHPAVWWISGVIRKEREHCCDDLAVSVCRESIVYARALANLQERACNAPFYAVALAKRRYSLLSRIRRLNRKPVSSTSFTEKWITLVVMILVITFLSSSFGVKSIDNALAAIDPVQEMSFGFNPVPIGDESRFSSAEPQDTLKKPVTSTINTTFFDTADQKEKKVKMVFEKGEVKELYIDGEKVPEEEMGKYQELIDDTLVELKETEIELKKAEEELKDAERALEEIDLEKMHMDLESAREDLERAMQEMKEIDMEEMSHDMQIAKEEFRKAMEQIREIDMEEIRNQYRQMEKEFQESVQHFQEEDWPKYQEQLEKARYQMQEAMSKIDKEDLEERYRDIERELEQFWQEIDTSQINRELRSSLEEIKRNMHQFNQQYIQELHREMEEARRAIRESMRELHEYSRFEREEMFEEQERQRQMQREEREELRMEREQQFEAQRRMREEEAREREARVRERKETEREREVNKALEIIQEQLVKDGFYEVGEPVDFELSGNRLLVDGKKQPTELFEKYKQLYEEHAGPMPETSTIVIKK